MSGVEAHRSAGPARLRWAVLVPGAASVAFGVSLVASAGNPVLGWTVLGALALCALIAVVAWRPVVGTYLYVSTVCLVAGIDRDTLIPLLRPNEALLAVVLIGAAVGGWYRFLGGARSPVSFTRVDLALAWFLLFSTVWPVTSVLVRGAWPTPLDVASLLPVCKLVALYLLVRAAVLTERQSALLVRLMVRSGAVVALIALLQTLHAGPVIAVLHRFYAPDESAGEVGDRGGATLGSPLSTGDVVVIALVLLLCCHRRALLGRRESLVLGIVLCAGVPAAGEFSTWIAAVVALGLLLWRMPELRRPALRATPLVAVAAVVGAPAFLRRVGEFSGSGVPESWLGRWDNLSNFFLPRFDLTHIVLGVAPNPVLDAPETWREVIYLESGYLYFLWIGGIPLLVAFVRLSVEVLRSVRRDRLGPGAAGGCASALEILWWVLLVLTVLDPHLTVRGTGDLLFPLLALARGQSRDRQPA
ncbi:hypothetical protein AB0H97_28875 [Streptomyces sp. NPDC050788]|jgi:hypothetical protein|uniref:hypothetical protein n=1 Tax=Streptomyces sp. NPDC050788 TaxID=3155041 RepID=UPI00342361B8